MWRCAIGVSCVVLALPACDRGAALSSPPANAGAADAGAADAPPAVAGAARTVAAARYVGRAACGPCHRAELEAWTGSHHDRAMEEPTPHAGAVSAPSAAGRPRFRFARDGRSVEVLASDGARAVLTIAYQLGTDPLEQPLVAGERGRLQALPFAWDTRSAAAGGGRWRLVTEGEALDEASPLAWTGPHFTWNHACAECHSTNVRKGYDEATGSFRTTFSEVDVSCEACHGPGSEHVACASGAAPGACEIGWRLRGGHPEAWRAVAGRATRLRAAEAPAPNELDVCGRCHARRRPLHAVEAPDASLLDSHLPELLDPPLYFPDGQIRDEVFEYGSFLQSRMHGEGVTCTDCHEPHGLALRASGNRLCARCHAAEVYDRPAHHHHRPGSTGAACVACHMPERTYMQVDRRRDHSLRIPRPELSVSLGVPNACSACHRDRADAALAATVARWRGGRPPGRHYGEILARARSGDRAVAAELLRLLGAGAPLMVRATAASLLGALADPSPDDRVTAGLRAALVDGAPLVRLGALRSTPALPWPLRLALVRPLLSDPVRAVRLEAARLTMDAPPEVAGAERAALDRALDELLAVTALNADRADARELRGRILESRGRAAEALREYDAAIGLDPHYWPAYANEADLLRARGEERAALAKLDEGLRRVPESAELHYARALALVRQGRRDEATAELNAAAAISPNDARLQAARALVGDQKE